MKTRQISVTSPAIPIPLVNLRVRNGSSELTSRTFNGLTRTATATCSCDESISIMDEKMRCGITEKMPPEFETQVTNFGGILTCRLRDNDSNTVSMLRNSLYSLRAVGKVAVQPPFRTVPVVARSMSSLVGRNAGYSMYSYSGFSTRSPFDPLSMVHESEPCDELERNCSFQSQNNEGKHVVERIGAATRVTKDRQLESGRRYLHDHGEGRRGLDAKFNGNHCRYIH